MEKFSDLQEKEVIKMCIRDRYTGHIDLAEAVKLAKGEGK